MSSVVEALLRELLDTIRQDPKVLLRVLLDAIRQDPNLRNELAQLLAVEQRNGHEPESPVMRVEEAASYLRCKRQRIDDLLSAGRLTRLKEGRRTLVLRSEVVALLRRTQ